MNSLLNTEMKTQNITGIECNSAQAPNMTRTVNCQNTIGLMTGGMQPSCRQTMLSLQTALQHTKITGPIMKLNPLTFGVSEREPNSGSTSNFPTKFIISAKGAPLLQQSSEQDYMKGGIQKENCSFILRTAASKSTVTVNDTVLPASSSCQDSSEQEASKGFVMISMPSLCEQQEINSGNGFAFVTDPADVLRIGESTSKSTIPIRISTRPILSQTPQRVMITKPQPSCPVLRAGGSQMKVMPSSAAHLQILSNDGKFQYVKLVTTPKDRTMIATDVTSKTLKLLVPAPNALPSMPVSATYSSASITKQDKRRPLQRLILPANYQLKTDSHAATSLQVAESLRLNPNETFCMVQTGSNQLPTKSMGLESEIVSAQNSIQPKSAIVVSTALGTAQKLHRPCSCSKSSCLKLYCECFATGEFCDNCNCSHCLNNRENENHRQRAIRSCLSRNPLAFHPKIGKSHESEVGRQHSRGCNCKRSGCLKNYCECYEAKIPCTEVCRCHGCKNCETDASQKSLMYLANAAEVRVQQRFAASTRLDSQLDDLLCKSTVECISEHFPHTFITGHVVDTIGECLLEAAERWECENAKKWEEGSAGDADAAVMNLLLEEFGRCANKLISVAGMPNS